MSIDRPEAGGVVPAGRPEAGGVVPAGRPEAGRNRFARLDLRARLLLATAAVCLVLALRDPLALLCCAGLLLLATLAAGGRLRGGRQALATVAPVLVVVAAVNIAMGAAGWLEADRLGALSTGLIAALPGPRGVLVGAAVGVAFVLRMVAMVWISWLVITASTADELGTAMEWAHAPAWLTTTLTTALAMIPLLARHTDLVMLAQATRGVDRRRGPFGRIRGLAHVMVPMLAHGVRTADRLTLTMASRGYGARRRRTVMEPLCWRPRDTLAVLVGVTAVLAGWLLLGLAGLR